MPKEITFYVIFGEKRDPSEICANPNLRNMTHITKKRLMYTFFTYTLKEITALGLGNHPKILFMRVLPYL